MNLSIAAGKPLDKKSLLLFLGLSGVFSLAALLFAIFGIKTAAALLALLFLLTLGFLDYPKFLLSAVFIRSALDTFTNTGLPIGPLNLNPAGLLGLLLVFFTPLHCLNKKEALQFPVAKGFLLFLLFSIPALFSAFAHFGAEGIVAVKEFIRLASLLALLISLLTFFKTPADARKLFYASLASLAIPLAVGFYQAAAGTGDTHSTAGQNRIFGTLFHPNTFALYLSVFLAVALAWHQAAPTFRKKVLLGLLLAAQFLTYSMSALVATGLILALHFRQSRKLRGWWVAAALLLLPTVTLFSENWQLRFRQLAQMRLSSEIQSQEVSNSFSWRVLHWYVLVQYAKEHPVLGWGLLTTEKVTPWKTPWGQGYAAHNDTVRIFLESGLLGLAGYLIFLFILGCWILKELPQKMGRKELQTALKGIFWMLVFLSAGAEEPLLHTAFVYYFFTFIVLAENGFGFGQLKPEDEAVDKNRRDL